MCVCASSAQQVKISVSNAPRRQPEVACGQLGGGPCDQFVGDVIVVVGWISSALEFGQCGRGGDLLLGDLAEEEEGGKETE